jgi:hypothetical protein
VDASKSACDSQASERKLAGAAKASFVKRCVADARRENVAAACETRAEDKKLAGAAKASFVKKCITDAK